METKNDDLIRAVFSAPEERKSRALLILQGEDIPLHIDEPLLISMGEATKILGVSRATLWRMVRAGRLAKVEIYCGAYRLRRADVIALANGTVVRNG
jgi:excisionase family DNA binding protein